ncbi:MAG: acylphosphatase [Piscinibacter sp.]|nr:acylphosphatase [Piscinibacter sp.]
MKPDEATAIETWLVRVHGRVQGVGFRYACTRQARTLGVAGWVRNRRDGTVEAMLQGPPQQIGQLRDWLRDGVPEARVIGIDTATVASATRFEGFEQRPTE